MVGRHRLLTFWLLGTGLVLASFYAAVAWLWSAAEESRSAALEREVLAAAGNDLAEGNLFKLGVTLSRLHQDGSLRYAEIRHLNEQGRGDLLFRTPGPVEPADGAFSGFRCVSQRRLVRPPGGGVGVVTRLPDKTAGAGCAALFLSADLPSDLRGFKNRLLTAFIALVIAILGGFSWLTMSWYRRILALEVSNRLMQAEKDAAAGRIAAQVAHDIRSPLAALDAASKDVAQMPEEKRLLIRSAVSRIRDIANNLSGRSQGAGAAEVPVVSGTAEVQFLSSLVDPLISEKRLQYRSRIGVEIESRLDAASYGLFAAVEPVEFKRLLSNLVNNSVEAIPDRGRVTVSLGSEAGSVLLRVADDGQGIAPEVRARLGRRGETHGKPGGTGLGLSHAKTSAESWGGSLDIRSAPGQGTTVTVRLPRAAPPGWFVSRLELEAGKTVVVFDDDTTIHQIWQGRFDSVKAKERGIEVRHLSAPAELRGFVREDPGRAREALFLTDYELVGCPETGLGLVEELALGQRSILVTSRFEEKAILEQCRRLGVRLIPKGLAGFVPLSIREAVDPPDAVLLDDDALVRMNWTGAAKARGLRLAAFAEPAELRAAAAGLPKDTAIYLDSKLGDGVRGEDVAKDLHAQGFSQLYLATGYDAGSLPPMPWIRKVVGKDPPWS